MNHKGSKESKTWGSQWKWLSKAQPLTILIAGLAKLLKVPLKICLWPLKVTAKVDQSRSYLHFPNGHAAKCVQDAQGPAPGKKKHKTTSLLASGKQDSWECQPLVNLADA